MNDRHEERINAVLEGLRHVEPDAFLRDRILAALRVAEAAKNAPASANGWLRLSTLTGAATPWLVAAALLLVAGSTLLVHRQARLGGSPNRAVSVPIRKRLSGEFGNSQLGHLERTMQGPPDDSTLPRVPHVSERHGISLRASAETHVSQPRRGAPTSADTAAEKDRSFPAPPLPLTEQERLLLRLVRHEPSTQLAELSAPAQDAAFQREKEHVTEYFAKPVTPVDPPDFQPAVAEQP